MVTVHNDKINILILPGRHVLKHYVVNNKHTNFVFSNKLFKCEYSQIKHYWRETARGHERESH